MFSTGLLIFTGFWSQSADRETGGMGEKAGKSLHITDWRFAQSPSSYCSLWLNTFCGLLTRWISDINPKSWTPLESPLRQKQQKLCLKTRTQSVSFTGKLSSSARHYDVAGWDTVGQCLAGNQSNKGERLIRSRMPTSLRRSFNPSAPPPAAERLRAGNEIFIHAAESDGSATL